MLKVGLTGGIGCGKSTAVDAFRRLGVSIVDADQISRDVVLPGSKALKEIAQIFGDEILLGSGELNRPLLKQLILSESRLLKKLEGVLHPRIRVKINKELRSLAGESYVIVDIPLLVEKNYQSMFDRIIVVDCLAEQQIQRVSARDKMSKSDIQKIISIQVNREKRLKFATDILDNTGDVAKLHAQINNLHKKLLK